MSIRIIEIFVRLRERVLTHKDILLKLEQIERKAVKQDDDIKLIFEYLRELLNPPVTAGQQFLLNDFEITKLTTYAIPEYQYNLKDHLGKVRLTFTTKDDIETTTATLETANLNLEQSQFLRINTAKRVNSSLFDRTNGSAPTTTLGHAQRLNGSGNEKYGVAKSISVMPGDVINAEVYAKYVDPVTSNWTGAFNTLIGQIAANTAGVVIDGAAYINSTSTFPLGYGVVKGTDTGGPKAYLNWLIFDRNFGLITGGFKQMGSTAKEAGTDVPHERVFNTDPILITQPGYVYIYLSNESPTPVEVYFDDFKVTHTKSPIIQQDDYYPFGLTFNSYQRENSVPNRIKFQGQEHIDDLGLNWDSFKWRNHQPDIGRFFNVDPLADKYVYNSPYAFAENRVIDGRELEGLEWVNAKGQQIYDPKANDGKGGYTQQATANDKRLGNSLQGTEKGRTQFSKLVNSESPITTTLNESPGPTYKDDASKKKGVLQLGVTENTTYKDMDLKTGKTEVGIEKSDIKINIGSIEKILKEGGTMSGEDLKGLNLEEVIGAVFGHEIEHTTIENVKAKDPEKPAHEVSAEIIKATKKEDEKK